MNQYEAYSDEQLIEMIRQGQSEIIDYIMEKYKNLVRKKANALFLIGGDTDDLNQEGMIGLFKAIRDFDSSKDASFGAFASLCISRQMYTAIEASNRQKHTPLNSYVPLEPEAEGQGDWQVINALQSLGYTNPEDLYIDLETVDVLQEKIGQVLSHFEKKVLDEYLQGKNYTQIADIMGKKPKSVDNALQRIKGKVGQLKW